MLKSPQSVAIFGAGIGGLTAAHELVQRGFEVDVFERQLTFGGKARSIFKQGTGRDGRHDLPGEHGLRIFPGFYRHLEDTMKSIPGGDGPVFQRLVETAEAWFCQEGAAAICFQTNWETRRTRNAWRSLAALWQDSAVPKREIVQFFWHLLRMRSACKERCDEAWEKISWSDFVGLAGKSAAYDAYFVRGLSHVFAAVEPQAASARTLGNIMLHMCLLFAEPGRRLLRVLDGPTTTVWFDPWVADLQARGVRFHTGCGLTALDLSGSRIRQATLVSRDGQRRAVTAEHYVCAVPAEAMQRLVTAELALACPSLAKLARLTTRFMGGIQYFLDRDAPMAYGHFHYASSAWSLSSISQAQFWRRFDLRRYGDGAVRGVVSVSIGDWQSPGTKTTRKRALDCTADELRDEIWAQMLDHLPESVRRELESARLVDYCIDPRICDVAGRAENLEPLLANATDSWRYRPEAWTEIDNLFLAADYVRTNTDLATMEGANEAGKRAVNAILTRSGSSAPPCRIWELWVPRAFRGMQRLDRMLYRLRNARPDGATPAGLRAAL